MAPVFPPKSDDYFSALGVPRRFEQDLALLERRYYELSRTLHPDRFGTASASDRATALERMSLVNQAYSTLKNSAARREYLLSLEGLKVAEGTARGTAEIPMELAEEWFEIQELLTEDITEATSRLKVFRAELDAFRDRNLARMNQLEAEYDRTQVRTNLDELLKLIQVENYLASLERNIEKWVK